MVLHTINILKSSLRDGSFSDTDKSEVNSHLRKTVSGARQTPTRSGKRIGALQERVLGIIKSSDNGHMTEVEVLAEYNRRYPTLCAGNKLWQLNLKRSLTTSSNIFALNDDNQWCVAESADDDKLIGDP